VPTLHVRNVPEVVYEALRLRAERDGRSIGSEAIELLQQALVAQQPAVSGVPRWVRSKQRPPAERFTSRARRALPAAAEEARALNSPTIEPEHLLLGLLDAQAVRRALGSLHVDLEELRTRTREVAGTGEGPVEDPQFGPRAKVVLELALREALAGGEGHIGAEHILVGLAREEGSPAARVLAELGADADALRVASLPPAHFELGLPRPLRPSVHRVVALEGSPEEWTEKLNRLGADGWELFAISAEGKEPRAIFRRVA
jgi:hypothetical protein